MIHEEFLALGLWLGLLCRATHTHFDDFIGFHCENWALRGTFFSIWEEQTKILFPTMYSG